MKKYLVSFLLISFFFIPSFQATALTESEIEQLKRLPLDQQMALAKQYGISLTASQVEKLKKLPPEQLKAIAEQYGISLPEDLEDMGMEFITPPVVAPRTTAESSAIEDEFREREEALHETLMEKKRKAEDKEKKGILRRRRIRETPEGQLVSPEEPFARALTELLVPEETDPNIIIRTFPDFFEKPSPLKVSTDIRQFGYNLFAGTPLTFAPATDIPVPRDYIIGPGDEILLHLYGARQEQLSLIVDRKGTINFPDEGPIQVTGLTFSRMTTLIEEIVKNKMIGVSAYITMGQLRSIRIFVLGDLERPGSYMISGLSTLSHALFVSGGIKKIGTLRNIELRRSGKRIASIDLYDFLLKGDTSGDVRLLPGDVVFVPPIGNTVGIAGEVRRPAIYELKGVATVGELISMAGGMLATGFKNMAQLERINDKGERIVIDLDLETSSQKKLQDGDLLKIFPVLDIQENIIYLIGNVKRPGKRAYITGMKVSSIIGKNEDLLPETYYSYALIEREAKGNREPEFIRFDLGKVIDGDTDVQLQPRDRIYIFNRSYFRQTPMVYIGGPMRSPHFDSRKEISLDQGAKPVVSSPGFYELKKGMRIIDLILASGGLLHDAHLDKAELYRTDPITKEVSVIRINLNKVLERDNVDNLLLQDLDHLVVHSIWEFKTPSIATISGEVNTPGTYPLAKGAIVSDLIFTGGSFTERAYRKRAELTRYVVVDGEKRESQHLEVDLEAVLAGDPNADIRLQPYDHLHILKITNWREAEKVTISGEVRFPGAYPIEEGEMLADLIDRAGGFTDEAFLFGARFTRKVIAEFQKKQFQEMADKLEVDVARVGAAPVSVGEEKSLARRKFAAESLTQLVDKLRRTEPDGRLVIRLMEPEKLRVSRYNILLQDGDTLHIPKKPDSVLVLGEVYNPTAFLYEKGKNSNHYIKVAGGLTEMANKKAIYIIKADGSVVPNKTGFFRHGVTMGPGDVVVVPEELKLVSGLEMTKDITQIIYQLGVAAAAYKTVGVFE